MAAQINWLKCFEELKNDNGHFKCTNVKFFSDGLLLTYDFYTFHHPDIRFTVSKSRANVSFFATEPFNMSEMELILNQMQYLYRNLLNWIVHIDSDNYYLKEEVK